jgi:hypothetical protein
MALHNKLFLINLQLGGPDYPSWNTTIPDEDWQNVLRHFVFKIADGFAFARVAKTADLFPYGLPYFRDWALEPTGLVEAEDDIVCQFRLNAQCQGKLLEYEFAVHSIDNPALCNYYEFDDLYFFRGERLLAHYIHHESMLDFINLTDGEAALIENLDPHIKSAFIDSAVFAAAFKAKE